MPSLPVVVVQPDERHANRLLCWSGMTGTEHLLQTKNTQYNMFLYIFRLEMFRNLFDNELPLHQQKFKDKQLVSICFCFSILQVNRLTYSIIFAECIWIFCCANIQTESFRVGA